LPARAVFAASKFAAALLRKRGVCCGAIGALQLTADRMALECWVFDLLVSGEGGSTRKRDL
jgi:hypothetical protein